MAISIIVEDGSNVPNANSYVSVEDAREYALNRGIELSIDNDEIAAQLINAMDYIEVKNCEFQGYPTNEDQPLSWPRSCVSINCKPFPSDKIPKQLIGAQIQLVIAQNSGIDIMPNLTSSDYVVEETVGPITTKYSDVLKAGISMTPQMTAVDSMLQILMQPCSSSGVSLRTVRV